MKKKKKEKKRSKKKTYILWLQNINKKLAESPIE
jgi:hypothetical protein